MKLPTNSFTFVVDMRSRSNIEELSIAFLREEVNFDVVGDYFTHDDFGIIMDYKWAEGPLLHTDCPYRLSGARLMRVLEGSIRYRINLLECEVSQGQVIWIPDAVLVEFLSATEDYRLQAITFNDKYHRRDDAKVFTLSEDEWQQLDSLAVLIRSVAGNEPFPKHVVEDLISAYLGILEQSAAFHTPPVPLPARKEQLFRQFISLVGIHFREHRDTAFYAGQLCLASHYLSPLIREASGESPSTWITKAVISEAKVLLKQSDKTVLQISEELGFPNAPFFCRYFKRETGMTPSEYRER